MLLKLNIRKANGVTFAETTTELPGTFRGGWVYFNLDKLELYLQADETYIFTWHLINGGALGVNTGSLGNQDEDSHDCNASGYTGQSRLAFDTNLDDWGVLWYNHAWHFNFRISGKE